MVGALLWGILGDSCAPHGFNILVTCVSVHSGLRHQVKCHTIFALKTCTRGVQSTAAASEMVAVELYVELSYTSNCSYVLAGVEVFPLILKKIVAARGYGVCKIKCVIYAF